MVIFKKQINLLKLFDARPNLIFEKSINAHPMHLQYLQNAEQNTSTLHLPKLHVVKNNPVLQLGFDTI